MVKKIFIIFILMFMFIGIFSLTSFANDYVHKHDFQNGFCTICNEKHRCQYVSTHNSMPGICKCGMSLQDYVPQVTNTNLDFWIGDTIDDPTMYAEKYYMNENGWLLHKKHVEITDSNNLDNGSITRPAVMAYIENSKVDKIFIYDPEIYIDTISLNSSVDEFKLYAEKNNMIFNSDGLPSANLGHYSIAITEDFIIISYVEGLWFNHAIHQHIYNEGYCSCGDVDPNYVPTHKHVWSEATCTSPAKCKCGRTNGRALGHKEVIDTAIAATCTTVGKTEGKHCSVCNEVIVAQKTVSAKGHTEVVDKAVAATCTTVGKTEGTHCSVCNKIITAQKDVEKNKHFYIEGECKCGKRDPYYTLPVDHDHIYKQGYCNICGKRHACNFVGATSSKPGVCLCGYSEADYVLQKTDTNLDLWIGEEVSNEDELNKNIIDNFYCIHTAGGYDLYLPKRYEEVFIDTQGNAVMPEHFVQYYIHPLANKRVKVIIIKDPNIYIDEISLSSSLEEFKLWAARNGLMVRHENDNYVSATSGYYTVFFSNDTIRIEYNVNYYQTENELLISGPCCDDDDEIHIDFAYWIIPCVVVVFSVLLYVWYCIKKDNRHSDKIDE